jgi:hypothetical protein
LEDPRLVFQPNIASIQESSYRETSLVLDHQQLKSHHGEISKIQVSLVVEAWVFIRAAKKVSMFTIYAMPIMELVIGLEALLIRYKEY